MKQIGPNGLVIFASDRAKHGSTRQHPGSQDEFVIDKDIEIIHPDYPIQKFVYLCDNQFHREILTDMSEIIVVGMIVVIGGNGFGLYLLNSDGQIGNVIDEHKISLPNSHRKGGQSSVRFERLAEEARRNYIRKVCEAMNKNSGYGPIVVAGPASLKNLITNCEILHTNVKNKICLTHTVAHEFIEGAKEVTPHCLDRLKEMAKEQDDQVIDEFEKSMYNNSDMWVIGDELDRALQLDLVEKIIVIDKHKFANHRLAVKIKPRSAKTLVFEKQYKAVGRLYYPIDLESLTD